MSSLEDITPAEHLARLRIRKGHIDPNDVEGIAAMEWAIDELTARSRLTLDQLQAELKPWQEHNFPDREAWEPLVGVQEEAGELAHAFLKAHQGIRTNENHFENEADAVADIIVYLADFCNARGHDMQAVLEATWAKVKLRDWQADREHAGA